MDLFEWIRHSSWQLLACSIFHYPLLQPAWDKRRLIESCFSPGSWPSVLVEAAVRRLPDVSLCFFEYEIQMELKRGLLSFRLNSSLIFTRVDLRLGLAYCDGKWNRVSVKKEGSVVSVGVNELTQSTSQAGGQPLPVNSPVYLGGIPPELQDSYRHLTLEPGKVPWEAHTIGRPCLCRLWLCCFQYGSRFSLKLSPLTCLPFACIPLI